MWNFFKKEAPAAPEKGQSESLPEITPGLQEVPEAGHIEEVDPEVVRAVIQKIEEGEKQPTPDELPIDDEEEAPAPEKPPTLQ